MPAKEAIRLHRWIRLCAHHPDRERAEVNGHADRTVSGSAFH
jgi:hypothetical protein